MKQNTSSTTLYNPFTQFAKGQSLYKTKTNDCVIYTRVSDIKQMDNLSLETQLKYSNQYAQQKGWVVREYFGGTYESAKSDERKQFQRMIHYVKTTKYKISYIIVYSLERFSRNDNSIWLANQLRKLGTEIVSVTQPIDTSNPAGQLQQKMLFLFGEHANLLRRQKCMAGTKERLLKGEWCNKAPIGYDHVKINGERKIVINAKGELIKKAFHWKMNEDCSFEEIRKRLAGHGLNLHLNRITEIFKNPFYCGILTHNALEGQTVEGIHEKLISREVFLRVNKIYQQSSTAGYSQKEENQDIPLKRFLHCNQCKEPMQGYIAKKWNIPYYKCNTKGCKNNRNANHIHNHFITTLQDYTIDSSLEPILKDQLTQTLQHLLQGQEETNNALKKKKEELNQKIERLEERFVLEEITAELYHKYLPKLQEEQIKIDTELEQTKKGLSKQEEMVDKIVELAQNLPKLWEQSNYYNKQKLQYLVFPKGMEYDRKNDVCRSEEVNPLFLYIADIARLSEKGQQNTVNKNLNYSVGSS